MSNIKPFDFIQTTTNPHQLWKRVTENPGIGQISYVFPLNDTKLHTIKDRACACNPRMMVDEDYQILVHNSFDRREINDNHEVIMGDCP